MEPLTIAQLLAVMPRATGRAAAFIGPLNQAMADNEIDTFSRVSAFLATIAEETNELTQLRENMNYRARRLLEVFPGRFTPEEVDEFDHQPERIANRVYANRMGNGDEASGDGWAYRGGGPIQLTGRDAYRTASIAVCGDADTLLKNPELIEVPSYGCGVAGWYWSWRGVNEYADRGDFDGVCDLVNRGRKTPRVGDANGYLTRVAYLTRAATMLA